MFKLLKCLKWKDWLMFAISLFLIATQVWLDLKLPDYMKEITELITTNLGEAGKIWTAGGYMILCALASAVLSLIVGFFAARIGSSMGFFLREDIYNKVQSFSKNQINKFGTASLITRTTNDVSKVQSFVAMGLQVLVKAPILAVWAIVKIAGKSWQWSVATAGGVAILFVVILCIVLLCLPKFKKLQKQTDEINRVARENLIGLRVVRAYNAEEYQGEKFEKVNDDLYQTNLFVNKRLILFFPTITLIRSGLSLAIYWIGAYLINNANMLDKINLFSDMIIFSSYAMQIIMAFMMLVMMFMLLPRTIVSARRINEILDCDSNINDGIGVVPTEEGTVEFKNVSFKYPDADEYVLSDISFKANKGETVAFIGSTGSGKSTLVDLVPRFYDVSEGSVLVDGNDVRDYKLDELHNLIGYVSQKSVLFSGSVNENVAFGESSSGKATEDDIRRAIKQAQAADFVEGMPNKYDSEISQGGKNISGGQKQRLSIARAFARNPEIFIFDDSFSALDYKTDSALRKTINEELSDKTCLLVAQRIGTIKNADKIIVLDEGKMVGIGTHEELLKNCKVYQEIALSQLSKEELWKIIINQKKPKILNLQW